MDGGEDWVEFWGQIVEFPAQERLLCPFSSSIGTRGVGFSPLWPFELPSFTASILGNSLGFEVF